MVFHDTVIRRATQLFPDTVARPLYSFLHCAVFLRQPERGHGRSTLAFGASQGFVCRELTVRVIIVIVVAFLVLTSDIFMTMDFGLIRNCQVGSD